MSDNLESSLLNNFLISLISLILGFFLFLFSFIFLYFNETVPRETFLQSSYIIEDKNLLNSVKVVSIGTKKIFLEKGANNFETVTWIFRGIGFFIMFFGLTLLLITIKGRKNIYGILSLLLSLLFSFLTVFLINFIALIRSGKFDFSDFFSNFFGEKVGNFFGDIFSNIFGLKSGFDIYFVFGILFLIFLFIYILLAFLSFFKKSKKTTFEKYEEL